MVLYMMLMISVWNQVNSITFAIFTNKLRGLTGTSSAGGTGNGTVLFDGLCNVMGLGHQVWMCRIQDSFFSMAGCLCHRLCIGQG